MDAITIACEGKDALELGKLVPFQGALKTLTKENYLKLKAEILADGFSFPVFVWANEGSNYIIDGHQRVNTLKKMQEEGYKVPPIPVAYVQAHTYKQAKKKVLAAASVYGRVDEQGLYEFLNNAGIEIDEIAEKIDLPYVNLEEFKAGYGPEGPGSGGEAMDDETYTKKIEAPIYEPRGDKPKLSELFDLTKYDELLTGIAKAKLSPEEETFLRFAASRHIVFNYEKIAEYYAHANEIVQDLFERSALVIIDFNKAIEYGFMKVTKDIASAYASDRDE